MNDDARIMLAAVADVVKERFNQRRMTLPVDLEIPRPDVQIKNELDMKPIADAIDRQSFSLREVARPADVTVQAPIVDMTPIAEAIDRQVYAFQKIARPTSVKVDAPVVQIDMTPIAKAIAAAIEKQTEVIERMLEKFTAACMRDDREVEIRRDKDGKVLGFKRAKR